MRKWNKIKQFFFLLKEREKFALRKHLHDTVEELRKFNARRKLKVGLYRITWRSLTRTKIMMNFQGAILAAASSSHWPENSLYSIIGRRTSTGDMTKTLQKTSWSSAEFDDAASSGMFLSELMWKIECLSIYFFVKSRDVCSVFSKTWEFSHIVKPTAIPSKISTEKEDFRESVEMKADGFSFVRCNVSNHQQ